ncbi:MAG: hypothetical protein WAK60_00400, partial [Sedimentisphaerales bacterium]
HNILVYKLTASGTSAYFETDPNGWLMGKGSASGYLVLDVDGEDPNILNYAQYIDYYTEKNFEGKTEKLYEIWSPGEDFAQSILPGRPPRGKDITALNLDLRDDSNSIWVTGWLLGTNSLTDIGTLIYDVNKTKVDVATSLKGVYRYISGGYLGDVNETLDEQSIGTITLTLDSKWTKTANNPDDTKGFDGSLKPFLDPASGPPDDPNSPRGLVNWLVNVQKYHPPIL